MSFETLPQTKFANQTIRVVTPEGTMFVSIMTDDSEKPVAVDIIIGKAGTTIRAWAQSLARIMTVALEHGVTIENFIEELSSQHSSKSRRSTDKIDVYSGPEGVCVALLKFNRIRHERRRRQYGVDDDDERGRIGRLAG